MPFIVLMLLIAAAIGGGTSLAAGQALPGDFLWNFKVDVNERLLETIAGGDAAKGNWDITLAETRLEEAAQLAIEGKLDTDTRAQLQTNFDAHARDVAARVAALQAQGAYGPAADVAARFQAAIASHASTLAEAKTGVNSDSQAALTGIINYVQATLDEASALSADASAKVTQ